MTGKLTYAFSAILTLLTAGPGLGAGNITAAPKQCSAVLASPSNHARLHLAIEPVVDQLGNVLRIQLIVGNTVEVTAGGLVGGLLKTTAEMEAMNPVRQMILVGPKGYRRVIEGLPGGVFNLPDGTGRARERFDLEVKTKFFEQEKSFSFSFEATLITKAIGIHFVDIGRKDTPFVRVGQPFYVEVRFRDARDDDDIDVVLKNLGTGEEEEIECLKKDGGKVYRSETLTTVISDDLKAMAGHMLEAKFEDVTKQMPVTLWLLQVLEKGSNLVIDNATLCEVEKPYLSYNPSTHFFNLLDAPSVTRRPGRHQMRLAGPDFADLDFSIDVGQGGAVTADVSGRADLEIEGSTLKAFRQGPTGIFARFEFYNRVTGRYEPVPEGIKVCLMNYDPASPDDEVRRFEIDNPYGNLIVREKCWEDGDDLYFKVDMEHDRPDVQVQYGGLEFDVEWSTKENDPEIGYFDDFVGNALGRPSGPLVYYIRERDNDNDGWSNDACFIIKTIKEVHRWYENRVTVPWLGVPDLDAEIGAMVESWAPPTSTTIALNDERDAQWDRATIAHEYSHQVMYHLSESTVLFDVAYAFLMGEIPTHYYTKESHPDAALLEGWAEFVEWAFVRRPAPGLQYDDGPYIPREHFWRGADGDPTNNSGEVVEGAVANAFYQIDRTVIKGDKHLFMTIFWDTLKTNPEDVKEFQDHVLNLDSLTAAQKQQIKDILQTNGIVYSRLKLDEFSFSDDEETEFEDAMPAVPQIGHVRLIAREMTASELSTDTVTRDVSDTDTVIRAHFEVLTVPLPSVSDAFVIDRFVFDDRYWREFAVVDRDEDDKFVASLVPVSSQLGPGFYAVRTRAETSFGTLDNFHPRVDGGVSPINTGSWYRNLGVVRVIQVTP